MLTASGKRSVSGRPMTTDNTADGSQQRHCSHCSRAALYLVTRMLHIAPLLAALRRCVPTSCGRLLVATTAGVCNDRYHYNTYVGEFGNRAATTLRIQFTRRTHATIQKTLTGHFRRISPRQNSPAQLLHNCRPARIPYTDRPCAHRRSYMERRAMSAATVNVCDRHIDNTMPDHPRRSVAHRVFSLRKWTGRSQPVYDCKPVSCCPAEYANTAIIIVMLHSPLLLFYNYNNIYPQEQIALQ